MRKEQITGSVSTHRQLLSFFPIAGGLCLGHNEKLPLEQADVA